MVIQNVCTQLSVPNVLPVRHPHMELYFFLETMHHINLWSSFSRIGNPSSSTPQVVKCLELVSCELVRILCEQLLQVLFIRELV